MHIAWAAVGVGAMFLTAALVGCYLDSRRTRQHQSRPAATPQPPPRTAADDARDFELWDAELADTGT